MVNVTQPDIERDEHGAKGQFFLRREGRRCGTLDYTLSDDGVVQIQYVEVMPDARGSGAGRRLVAAAVEWARETNRKVAPICSFAGMVLRADPTMHDVLW
jgi:predicted GNAT family acetyltransferase